MDKDESMAIRFSWTEKYDDLWYRKLPILGKQLYDYLWHKCDIAGLWEIDLEKAAFDIGADTGAIQGALKGLEIKYKSLSGGKIWLVNFLKCQKNLPLNPKNAAHASIINRLLPYVEISEIFELINTPEIEGLTRGFKAPIVIVISNSKGNKGIVKGKFKPPIIDEIKKYIQENPELSNIDPIDFYKGYNDSGWIDTQGRPIRNWKLKLRTRSNCAKERGGNDAKSQTTKSNKCFVCKNPATKLVDTGGGKDLLCDDCLMAYQAMPDFRDWKKRVIPKTKCDRGTLEKMILAQKAKR